MVHCFRCKLILFFQNMEHPIIYFDGICMLCNRFVSFVLRHDTNDYFRFSTVQELGTAFDAAKEDRDTIVLFMNDKYYEESDAVIRIVEGLGGIWKICYILRVIPKFIRNAIYRSVARNRFRFFGKPIIAML